MKNNIVIGLVWMLEFLFRVVPQCTIAATVIQPVTKTFSPEK